MPSRDAVDLAERELERPWPPGADGAALAARVLRPLRRLITVDAAFVATADPDTLLFTGGHTEEPLRTVADEFLDDEYGDVDVNRFAVLATSTTPVATLDGATRGDRTASRRYRDILRPLGLGDELRAALRTGPDCWGYLCLHRDASAAGFSAAEVALVARLAPRIASGLRRSVVQPVPAQADGGAPGVLLLGPAGTVLSATPQAEPLLALLDRDRSSGLPFALRATVRAVLERGYDGAPPPRARLRAADGQWLDVTIARLPGANEERAAVVVQRARSTDTVPLLLSAHGLTPREAEVARLVLRGTPTPAIGATLHISAYTVQDHLKAVFDKTGVRSRRDLVRLLMGR